MEDHAELRRTLERERLFATLSHEIRTPLNGVMGVAGALRRTRLNARQTEMLRVIEDSADELAAIVWLNVRDALKLPPEMDRQIPPFRVVKEKRATFAATPAQDLRRPVAKTAVPNLVLAGDWTKTGLPATIEGAIRSGRTAAEAILAV